MSELNVDAARIIDIERGAQTNLEQRLIKNTIRHTVVFFIGEQRRLMRGDGVDQALDERRVQVRSVRKAVELFDLRDVFIGVIEQNILGLGGGLHCHDLVLKIGKRVDIALGIDSNHLSTRKIRTGPTILVFSTRHTKAAHDAVELAVRQQLFFLFPVDELVFWLVANAGQSLGQNLDIQADDIAVLVAIHKRRVEVAADIERFEAGVFGMRSRAFFRRCRAAVTRPGVTGYRHAKYTHYRERK